MISARTIARAGVALSTLSLLGCGEQLVAHELRALLGTTFEVAPGERSSCFDVTAQMPDGAVVAFVPRLAPGVAHHVALHRAARAPLEHDCASMGRSTLLYMGSPGDDPLVAPDGRAFSLEHARDGVFVLELHYVNTTGTPRADASGVTLVVGGGRDAATVGPWVVGDVQLDIPPRAVAHEEGRVCTIRSEAPVTLYAVSPHMHARGVALSVVREREGVLDTIVEVDPFDPVRQRTITLERPITLAPGDRIQLRCVYDNLGDEPIGYGVHLEDEMCFAYFWASPIAALHDDAPFCH